MAKEEIVLNVKSDIGSVVKDAEAVKDEIKGARKETDKLSESASGATTQTEKLGKAAKKSGGGFKRLKTVVQGVGVALKAAGIGIIVALVAKLMEVFGSNQKVLDKFNTGMTALTIAFNDLFTFLSDNVETVTQIFKDIFENPQESLEKFGDMIKDNLIERFNSLLDTFGFMAASLGELFAGNFKEAGRLAKEAGKEMVDTMTGVDGTVGKVAETVEKGTKAIIKYGKKTLKAAENLTAAQKAAALAQAEFENLNATYLKDAEDQRQIRDDVTKTFAVRIKANEDLLVIQNKQQDLQRAALEKIERAAQLQFDITGKDEDRLELLAAQTAQLQLEEAINGQISEQKTNQVGLEQELLDAQKELALVGEEGRNLELAQLEQDYQYKLDLARKAGVDRLKIDEWYQGEVDRINAQGNEKEKALAKAKLDMQLDIANKSVQLIGAAAGEGTAIARAAAIAQATIAGTQSVINAFNSANANVGLTAATAGAYPVTMAALAGGFAALNIAKIASGGKPSASDASAASGGAAAAAAPSPQMMSGAFQLGGAMEQEPLKAFVVTDEMTNSQNQLANIRRRSTI